MTSVFVLDMWMPTPDRDGASLRITNLLAIMAEMVSNITFAADAPTHWRDSVRHMQAAGLEVINGEEAIKTHLQEKGHTYDLVLLSRVPVASKYIGLVKKLAPQARVVFDTTDLKFLRGLRGAKVTNNVNLLKQALQSKKDELTVAQQADITLVVSPVEKEILEKEYLGIKVQIISLIHQVYGSTTAWAKRAGLLFVGAFPHHPNEDGMGYFCREIHPRLVEKLGPVPTYIIGSNPPDWLMGFKADHMHVLGYVPDIAPYLKQCRLSLAPLRYGAGIKSKVLLSLSYGLPVVASSIAAEGMPMVDGRDILLADDAESFAQRVTELYQNETLWQQLSNNGPKIVAEHFSFASARAGLVQLFTSLDLPLQAEQSLDERQASPVV